ncbi:MAG: RNA-binding domain-containing protein [Candidatus Nanoarchaeia archaeon]
MDTKELNLVLEKGEGQFVEFKESFDAKSLAKEIVAFANASGGKIFLGVNDKGVVKGININNTLKSKITDLAKGCDPSIIIQIETLDSILIVDVKEGSNKPYACKEGFYMRMGPNSQKMKRDEIINLSFKSGNIRFDEQICTNFDWKDFDDEKFEYYLKLAGLSYNLSRDEMLRNLRVLTDEGFTNAGVLYFAKNPFKYIMTSKVRCVHFRDDERVEILDKKEVDKGIIGNIEYAVSYIKERVPVRYEIKKLARDEFPEYPEDAYREIIVNAIIHFDYFDGSNIAIEKLKSSIIVNNKGELLFDKKLFGKRSELRNRLLADLLSRTEYMEKVGTGIKRINEACKENNNKIEFDFTDTFWVEIFSNAEGPERWSEKWSEKWSEINARQKEIVGLIMENPKISRKELSNLIGINPSATQKHLQQLKEKGLIRRVGPAKGGYWKVMSFEL